MFVTGLPSHDLYNSGLIQTFSDKIQGFSRTPPPPLPLFFPSFSFKDLSVSSQKFSLHEDGLNRKCCYTGWLPKNKDHLLVITSLLSLNCAINYPSSFFFFFFSLFLETFSLISCVNYHATLTRTHAIALLTCLETLFRKATFSPQVN